VLKDIIWGIAIGTASTLVGFGFAWQFGIYDLLGFMI